MKNRRCRYNGNLARNRQTAPAVATSNAHENAKIQFLVSDFFAQGDRIGLEP